MSDKDQGVFFYRVRPGPLRKCAFCSKKFIAMQECCFVFIEIDDEGNSTPDIAHADCALKNKCIPGNIWKKKRLA